MNVIASTYEIKNPPLCKPVKCPSCGRGRICDVPISISVKHAPLPVTASPLIAIYVKCQCCGRLVVIHNCVNDYNNN